jgi:hypothetical protein
VTVADTGKMTIGDLYVGHGTALTMHGGDLVSSLIDLSGGSVLTVDQVGGHGLMLNGTLLGDLTLTSSTMDLVFTSTAAGNWVFAWKDPSTTQNWISTLEGMIGHQIELTLLPGQSGRVVDVGGYTEIIGMGGSAVPEPSSLVLAGLAIVGTSLAAGWRRDARS